MNIYTLLAEAFCYPHPGLLEKLEVGLDEAGTGPGTSELDSFIKKIQTLSLAEWEEVSTRTLDLSPAAAPYVGFHIWGESYPRGEFMAKLNRAMYELDVDPEGELPDHLVPILRYLNATDQPIPELIEQLEPALQRMIKILRKKDKDNPYLSLFKAVLEVAQSHPMAA
jgi:nitrate reductase delta subunit